MSENKDIISAKETINREIAALRVMESMLDNALSNAHFVLTLGRY